MSNLSSLVCTTNCRQVPFQHNCDGTLFWPPHVVWD